MIEDLLKQAVEQKVSDIHITSDDYIAYRSRTKIYKSEEKATSEEVLELVKKLTKERYIEFKNNKQIDLGGTIAGVRYRANCYYERGKIAVALRVINDKVKTIVELNLPYILFELVKKQNGIILITGPTGSGKSTTLAAMIDEINSNYEKHIVTIEDPIEYLFENKKSLIHQREVGVDVESFNMGLKSILRQDPDVIMIGEMRDKPTVETALKASETGHLVLTTLHTSSVKSTINRITGLFNADDAQQIRTLLSESLIAIVTQKLIKTSDGRGMIPAFEILINTVATANLIRKGEVGQIDSFIQMDQKIGSLPMSKSIETLLNRGMVNMEDVNNA